MRKKIKFSFSLLTLISLIFISCGSNDESKRILLNENWEYSLNQNGPFETIPALQLADLTNLIPGGTGFIYLQNKFEIPQNLANENISCFLGRITMADETYLNGILTWKCRKFWSKR